MSELLIVVGVHLAVLGVPMYLTTAWWNARIGVRHYESLIPSYEGHVAYWRDKDQRHYREVLATLIKHRRGLRLAERYSWPFTIVRDEDIIARDEDIIARDEAKQAKRAKPTEQPTKQATPTRDEARRYRSLAKDARDEAARAEAEGLDGGVWHSLAAMWDEAAEAAVSARFAAECTCERHRVERREA